MGEKGTPLLRMTLQSALEPVEDQGKRVGSSNLPFLRRSKHCGGSYACKRVGDDDDGGRSGGDAGGVRV
jgi:hypothetical protein